jgi:hypothetical protein
MTSEFSNLPTIELGVYEHYKGKRYKVLGVGRHTESDEYYVVYAPLYEHKGQPEIWVRPYAMFIEEIDVNGTKTPRFTKISEWLL